MKFIKTRLIEMTINENIGGWPTDKEMPIIDKIRINSLGSSTSLLVLQTEAALNPIKRTYPQPKANATSILSNS